MTKLNYAIRLATAPGETMASRVPVIVNRKALVSLTRVVEDAIDRGRILGAKAAAAEEIARGIAEQLYWAFSRGFGVKFGEYFYGRLYLDGQCDANGTLVEKVNDVNVRLIKGGAFDLTLDDFSFSYEGADDQPKVDFLLSTGQGEMPPRNVLRQRESVVVQGKFLKLDGDTAKVTFREVGGDATVDVTSFTSAGPDSLNFAWPAALDATKSYEVTVYRTAEDGTERASNGKTVEIEAGEEPAAPELTKIYSFQHEDDTEHLYDGNSAIMEGTALGGATLKFQANSSGTWSEEIAVPSDEFEVTGTKITVDGMWLADECATLDVGYTDPVRFIVTTPNGTAMIASIWMENS